MNLPVASCMICGQERELAVWVDPSLTGGKYHGVCFPCREGAQHHLKQDGPPPLGGVYHLQWIDLNTVQLLPLESLVT